VSADARPTPAPAAALLAGALRRLRVTQAWSARIAAAVLLLLVALVAIGPAVAPHSPTALIGPPFAGPSSSSPLGTDYAGEDVLSRVLAGGRTVIEFAFVATLLAYLSGGMVGLIAGYRRGWIDAVLMRCMDVLLAFPPIIFLLLLATGFGNNVAALIIGIAVVHMPGVARIIRAATLDVSVRGYVEAAVARGDRLLTILRRELVPNMAGPLVADAGPRFTVSILLVAAVNFLGLGIAPPTADWALMISENRAGITINPLAVLIPALMIGLLTISLNTLADAFAASLGTTLETESLRR
jgi:peptide/nickel transport system permease protein